MKQTIEIEVPDGKKAVWKDNKVIFEDIKPQLPKTWEEFCKQNVIRDGEHYIDSFSDIVKKTSIGTMRNCSSDRNILPNKQAAEAHLALMQLHQLRDCYRQGWIPDLADKSIKYCIKGHGNLYTRSINYRIVNLSCISDFLLFPTRELAQEFLTNFRELIEQAGDLI